MKNKLLTIIDEIQKYNSDECSYNLTINYKPIIHSFSRNKFEPDSIKTLINDFKKNIKNFNLTITNRVEHTTGKKYFYNFELMFLSNDTYLLTFWSNYLSNRELKVKSIDKLFDMLEEHKKFSKNLYNIIHEIN